MHAENIFFSILCWYSMFWVKDQFNCLAEQNNSGSLCNDGVLFLELLANEENYIYFVQNKIVKADMKAALTHADCTINSKLKSVECF